MGIIKELPKGVVEKIAAGEVVERPASVIKELVENSIDAGASSITIHLEDGGKGRMVVLDDGCGMARDDLAESVKRHATSKIRSEDDLGEISTMGFRGEALYAIGAVSSLSIESRPKGGAALEGARIEVEGGAVKGPFVVGCDIGTRVEVARLFYNIPARMKFLRSGGVEFGHVMDVLAPLMLANPGIRFELFESQRRRITAPAVSDAMDAAAMRARMRAIAGEGFGGGLEPFAESAGEISAVGFVSEEGRKNRDVYVFLNGRPIRDRMLMHAAASALGDGTDRARYPALVMWLCAPPRMFDVNVHPAKKEVRFESPAMMHDFVRDALRKALSGSVRKSVFSPGPAEAQASPVFVRDEGRGRDAAGGRYETQWTDVLKGESPMLPTASLRIIGQLSETYLVCESSDGSLVLIDQHAAHERLAFERLRSSYRKGSVPVQVLLIPETIELGAKDSAYVTGHMDALSKAGFEVEPFGGNTMLVKAVPTLLSGLPSVKLFEDLSREAEELGTSHSVDEAVDRIFATVACHAAVRAGDRLSDDELGVLAADLKNGDVTHCPHGRPVAIRIGAGEIEGWFKRKN
jgi:DNA mismatch repair protein MutL